MIVQPKDSTARRQADRLGVLDAQRAKHGLRTDAAFFQAVAENVIPNPAYGDLSEQAAMVLRRGYVAIALQLLELADRAEEREVDYRSHLNAGGAA